MFRVGLKVIILFFASCVCNLIDAAIVTVPNLPLGSQYRLVFTTSAKRDAVSSSIQDYNSFVSQQVMQVPALANLNTSWFAIASTNTTSAIGNTNTYTFLPNIPIFCVDGAKVADNYADLWDGSLDRAIWTSENGDRIEQKVWTGTDPNGNSFGGLSLGNSLAGYSYSDINGSWTFVNSESSTTLNSMYAISGILTVSVPEPSSMLMVIFVIVVLLIRCRSRSHARAIVSNRNKSTLDARTNACAEVAVGAISKW